MMEYNETCVPYDLLDCEIVLLMMHSLLDICTQVEIQMLSFEKGW